jgi:hypothetical protein
VTDRRYTLGLVRLVLVLFVLIERGWSLAPTLRGRLKLPQVLFTDNVGLTLSPLPWPMDDAWITPLVVVTLVSGALAAVGLFTRASLAVFALGVWHISAVASAYGFYGHVPCIYATTFVLLALLPGSECLSLDARRRTGSWLGDPPAEHGVRVLLLLLSTIYVGAGLAKIRYGGLHWFNGDVLAYYLRNDQHDADQFFALDEAGRIVHYLYRAVPSALAGWAREHDVIVVALAWLTVVVELAFPLALWRRARASVLLATAAMHVGIAVMMNVYFFSTIALLVALIGLPRRLVSDTGAVAADPPS